MAALCALQTGCRKDEIKVYQVPKENPGKVTALAPRVSQRQLQSIGRFPPGGRSVLEDPCV